MKKIIIAVILYVTLFCCNYDIKALSYNGCEYSDVSKLRGFASNVNLSYDYYIENNVAYFNVTISNLVPDIYFVDSFSGKAYYYHNSYDGEITINGVRNASGNYRFYSTKEGCEGIKLGNKYYSLPLYNNYYNTPECQQNRDFKLCQKWMEVNYSYNEFKKELEKYNNSFENENNDIIVEREKTMLDKFISFYIKYYHVLLISVITVCVIIMVIVRKKNKFDL